MYAYTQAELAEKIGVNSSAISLWENDVNEPNATDIARLALPFDGPAVSLPGIDVEVG